MRIISGIRKGYRLKPPDGLHTRPTTDRVKEAVFNIIQTYLPAESVLDLFAGSGAMGIEALSRGTQMAVFVDNDRQAIQLIKENLNGSGLIGQADVIQSDAEIFIKQCTEQFELIFFDPPYNIGMVEKTAALIAEHKLLKSGGLIIMETEVGGEIYDASDFKLIKTAKYGKTIISILQG